jgi:hypothetical protein
MLRTIQLVLTKDCTIKDCRIDYQQNWKDSTTTINFLSLPHFDIWTLYYIPHYNTF